MTVLLTRNLKLFFRDKVNLFFSLLAIIIIIVLYAVFLGNVWGGEQINAMPEANVLKFSWLGAGVLAVATVTAPLGAFEIVMNDRTKKIFKGFYASPLKRSHITLGYVLNSFIVGVIIATITAIFWAIYIFSVGGEFFSPATFAKILGIIILASLSNTAIIYFIVSFVKTHSAFNTVSTIIGTLIGFLMGIYLPIGALPETVQYVIKLFPPSHAALLLRQTLMHAPMQSAFADVPPEFYNEFKEVMGIVFYLGDYQITPLLSVAFLSASAVIFFGLSLINKKR
jgi:multidrug/hemolysin transport system permease protein